MKARHLICLSPVIFLYMASAMGMTFDAIEKDVTKKRAALKSISYKEIATSKRVVKEFATLLSSKAFVEMRKKDNLWLRREEMHTEVKNLKGEELLEHYKAKELTIEDGEWQYCLKETDGRKEASRRKSSFTGGIIFALPKEEDDIEVMPEASIEDDPCYVLRKKHKSSRRVDTTTWYLSKSSGLMRKAVVFIGDETVTVMTKKLKIDSDISMERFVFEAPDGVAVTEEKE